MERGVVLIGFMGSGKSTVGPMLADAMGLDFVDLDQRIVDREGCSISDLFEYRGEKGFRVAEKIALDEVLLGGACVLACGGGTPCQPGLLERLSAWGHVAFLDAPFAVLEKRGLSDRPLWNKKAEGLFRSRRSTYQKADIHLDADQPPEKIGG